MQTGQVLPPKGIDDALAAGVPITVIRGEAAVMGEIRRMKGAAEALKPQDAPAPPGGGAGERDERPVLDVGDGDLATLVRNAWEKIEATNEPPRFYLSAAGLSYLGQSSRGERVIMRHSLDSLRLQLSEAIRCERYDAKSGNMRPCSPSEVLVKSLAASNNPPVPVVNRVVEVPVVGCDGEIQTRPGYHAGSQTYYAPSGGLVLPEVPIRPTSADIDRARAMLLEPLRDFPFTGPSEFAHAIAAMLLPFVREMITGPTPLHLVVKPTPGTGAGLLCDVIAALATGRRASPMAEARDEDEQRKRLTAYLIEGHGVILLDNLSRLLAGAPLAVALTADTWTDRVLGSSASVKVPVRCLWLATGNNVQTSTEMARRIVRIRLDAHIDQPHRRSADEFRHPDLMRWVDEHRAELVWSALTLIRAWIAAGKPSGRITLGSYESWAAVMGGIMDVAGIQGFLGNLDEFYEQADAEGAATRALIAAWWERYGQSEITAADLFPLASEALDLGEGSEQGRKVRWGKRLAALRDRIFGTLWVVQSGFRHSAKVWQLREVTSDPNGGGNGKSCPLVSDLFAPLADDGSGEEKSGSDCQKGEDQGSKTAILPLSSPNPPRVNGTESQSIPGRWEDGEDFTFPYVCVGVRPDGLARDRAGGRGGKSSPILPGEAEVGCKTTQGKANQAGEDCGEDPPPNGRNGRKSTVTNDEVVF